GGDRLDLPVHLAVRVDEPPAAQPELSQVAGDRAPADRGSALTELEGDARCRPLVLAPHRLDPRHRLAECRGRLPNRSRRAIKQPEFAELPIAVHPLRCSRTRDAHLGGHVRYWTGAAAFDESLAAFRGERGRSEERRGGE